MPDTPHDVNERWAGPLTTNIVYEEMVDDLFGQLGAEPAVLNSVLGRHAARALEIKLVADHLADWVVQLSPGEPVCASYEIPEEAQRTGIPDAPKGALGHWISIKGSRIENHQLVVPPTWNASPQDDRDQPGPGGVHLDRHLIEQVGLQHPACWSIMECDLREGERDRPASGWSRLSVPGPESCLGRRKMRPIRGGTSVGEAAEAQRRHPTMLSGGRASLCTPAGTETEESFVKATYVRFDE